ncbi:hypothetical protein CR513_23630, partial [Mucuna pruriens]
MGMTLMQQPRENWEIRQSSKKLERIQVQIVCTIEGEKKNTTTACMPKQNPGTYDSFNNGINGTQNFSDAAINSFNAKQNFSAAMHQSVSHSGHFNSSASVTRKYSDYSRQEYRSAATTLSSTNSGNANLVLLFFLLGRFKVKRTLNLK